MSDFPKGLLGLILECIQMKTGNKEFALFYMSEGDWTAEIGNPTSCVMLGEASAEFSADGRSAIEAVENLILDLEVRK